jgi:ribosomal protein S18 acetylase RimI-like enzyme
MIKKISAESTFSVRNPVLRPNLPVETCRFEGDNLPSTSHFGFFIEEKLTGIVSVFAKINDNWPNQKQIQVRGMAVLHDFQKQGIGDKLMQHAIAIANENKTELIWFNARKNAVPFYEKLGFHIKGTAFEIEGVGTHFLMYRLL